MPFVTEELWQHLPVDQNHKREVSIMTFDYPSASKTRTNERVEFEMEIIQSTVKSIRSLRAQVLGHQKNERLPAVGFCQTEEVMEIISSHQLEIQTLATLSSIEVLLSGRDAPPAGCAFEDVNENLKVYVYQGSRKSKWTQKQSTLRS